MFLSDSWSGRSRRPCGLRRGYVDARVLRFRIRIPPVAWMSVCCECCMVWSRSLCDGLITRPEESYWLWCVVACDLETSRITRSWPTGRCYAIKNSYYRTQSLTRTFILYLSQRFVPHTVVNAFNTLRTGSFKLFKRPFPGFLTILNL
jgi:hypothetical protein